MGKLLTKAGDRLLGAFLGSTDAGACVPEYWDYCYCRYGYVYRVNCVGSCAKTGTRC